MSNANDLPKLRLASTETLEERIHRCERIQRATSLQRESNLENSLAPFRVGSVPFLNAAPLVRGLEDQVVYHTPAKLAEMLQREELDAALVSITEVLFHNGYEVLDGIAIASLNEVKSVLLAHRRPLEEMAEVFYDTASLASVNLLRVLLAERNLRPRFQPLGHYAQAAQHDYVLLIGDVALDFLLGPREHEIWDLGSAWYELTQLPFIYAVWALRRGIAGADRLRRQLREARDFGLDTLDYLISSRTEYTYDFRRDYLGWNIHYHLGADERRGLDKFIELLRKHGLGPVFEPTFVG